MPLQPQDKVAVTLTVAEWNAVAQHLAQRPYIQVAALIQQIGNRIAEIEQSMEGGPDGNPVHNGSGTRIEPSERA